MFYVNVGSGDNFAQFSYIKKVFKLATVVPTLPNGCSCTFLFVLILLLLLSGVNKNRTTKIIDKGAR